MNAGNFYMQHSVVSVIFINAVAMATKMRIERMRRKGKIKENGATLLSIISAEDNEKFKSKKYGVTAVFREGERVLLISPVP